MGALVHIANPRWICVLLWDVDLNRYIVGDTWLSCSSPLSAPDVRRFALDMANKERLPDAQHPRWQDDSCWFHPLNAETSHVGALCMDADPTACEQWDEYGLLTRALSRTIHIDSRLEQAERERLELETDRRRLEDLLRAVEVQQRTIDHLLMVERQLSASLEIKVEERTKALRVAQDRLIQSEKLAVIGQLASSLAHELNNPLAGDSERGGPSDGRTEGRAGQHPPRSRDYPTGVAANSGSLRPDARFLPACPV